MSKRCKKEDIIRKLVEEKMTMRGKMRIVRQDREEIHKKATHMSEEEQKDREQREKEWEYNKEEE